MPPGVKRIRHRGLLAPVGKMQRLALARQLLAMPTANLQAREDAQAFVRRAAAMEIDGCARCKVGRLRVLQELSTDRVAPATTALTACWEPP